MSALTETATAIGMRRKSTRWGPCPACNAKQLGKRDKRSPIVIRDAWRCYRCDQGGDAIDLVSFALLDRKGRHAGERFVEVKAWFRDRRILLKSDNDNTIDDDYDSNRVPSHELLAGLRSCVSVKRSGNRRANWFVEHRNYTGTVHAGVLPRNFQAPWWATELRHGYRSWTEYFPLVVPAYNGNGELVSMQGRNCTPEPVVKTKWPRGYDARGLLFAEPIGARPLLKRTGMPKELLIVEGLTDFLWAAQSATKDLAVIGVASGSASALALLRLEPFVQVYIATDPDETGDKYAQEIANALSPVLARRVPLHSLS